MTEREAQVLEAMTREASHIPMNGAGHSLRKRVGRQLGIAPSTVTWHLSNLYAKVGADCLIGALVAVGWLRLPDRSPARADES